MKKYAVITGASSGIGAAFAKKLAKQGYALILIARRKARLDNLAKQLPTECEVVPADLADIDECKRIYKYIADKPVEIFINNAGIGDCGPFLVNSLDKEMQMIQLNICAVHFFTKRMLQKMQKADCGYVLNVASCAGLLPSGPYMATYYATKSYVASLTRAAAMELKECNSNVYIGCLCPGPVNTEFNHNANVTFSLKGISANTCAAYALKQMKKHKTVIIPNIRIKSMVFFGRFLPQSFLIRLVSKQQKKKIYS